MPEVRVVNFRDPYLMDQCLDIERSAFPDVDRSVIRDILTHSRKETIVLGWYEGDELVGLNGFLAHSVCRGGSVSLAYQSCISATLPEFRGRGIFVELINESKRILKERDGAFIFGYPNSKSGPIFKNKLGFDEIPMTTIDIPCINLDNISKLCFDYDAMCGLYAEGVGQVEFDAREAASLKRDRYGDVILCCEHYTNFLFGRVELRKLGPLQVRILKVGGIEINKPPLFGRLLEKARAMSGVHLIRITIPVDACVARAARFGGGPSSRTEPLIVWPLNWNTKSIPMGAWVGLKDVY